jgi:hypothetical protein
LNWNEIALVSVTLIFIMDPLGNMPIFNAVVYPNDDLRADLDASGRWVFRHKDGSLY